MLTWKASKLPRRVLTIATVLRNVLEDSLKDEVTLSHYRRLCIETDETLAQLCHIASCTLTRLLKGEGIPSLACEGEFDCDLYPEPQYHWWVVVDGHCLDVTATQFGPYPKVFSLPYSADSVYKPQKSPSRRQIRFRGEASLIKLLTSKTRKRLSSSPRARQ